MKSESKEVKIQPMIEALLDSWDRNNTITVNLLRAVPADAWSCDRWTAA